MKKLETRLAKLEAQHAGPVRIYVTDDDGETYGSNGEIFTRAQMDAMQSDGVVFRVIRVEYEDQAAQA